MNNLMDLLKKTLFSVLVVCVYFFLLGTSYDLLTKPNTISNLLGFIGVTILLILGMLFIYNGIKIMIEGGFVDKKEISEAEQKWKEHVEFQMEKMKEIHKQNEALKKKSNPKQFDGVESDEPFVKTRKKPKTEKVLGEFQINNKEKVRKSTTTKTK